MREDYVPIKDERETIITFTEGDKNAEVYTMSKVLVRKMDDLLATRDDVFLVSEESVGGIDAKTYLVPKSWVRVKPPKKYNLTEEERAALGNRLREGRKST